jgi:uncharacterized membrane protein
MEDSKGRGADILGYAALAALIALGLYAVATLPATIPIRFDNAGHASDFGSKWTLMILPAAAAFAFALISIVQSTGARANLPFAVPVWRADAVQAVTNAGMAQLKVFLPSGFIAIEAVIFASSSAGALSPFFLPAMALFVVGLLALVANMLVRCWQAAQGDAP